MATIKRRRVQRGIFSAFAIMDLSGETTKRVVQANKRRGVPASSSASDWVKIGQDWNTAVERTNRLILSRGH